MSDKFRDHLFILQKEHYNKGVELNILARTESQIEARHEYRMDAIVELSKAAILSDIIDAYEVMK